MIIKGREGNGLNQSQGRRGKDRSVWRPREQHLGVGWMCGRWERGEWKRPLGWLHERWCCLWKWGHRGRMGLNNLLWEILPEISTGQLDSPGLKEVWAGEADLGDVMGPALFYEFYGEVLTSECDCIWRQGLLRGKSDKIRSLGWDLIQYGWCRYEKRLRHRQAQRKGRRQPTTIQGRRVQNETTLPTPWSWTSSLQNCERINVCCLSTQSLVCVMASQVDWYRRHHRAGKNWNNDTGKNNPKSASSQEP